MKSQRVQKTRTTWQARGIAAVARFGMLVAILGALALRVPVAQVSAGGESLTASENPVIIPFGKSSQSFTLSWNSGNGQPIEFTGSLNGGPESGTFPGPAVGTAAESINLGEQFTWRMYTPGKKQLLAALTVTTKSALQAVAPCAQQCIKSVQVDPHGTFANFEIVTVPAVKVTLAASVVGQPGVASATFNLGMDKDWHTFLMDLKPNTKYTYDVKATDSDGNVQHKTGTFTTLHR